MEYKKIPGSYKVGGQNIEVRHVERCDDNDMGACYYAGGFVEISKYVHKDTLQSEDSKINTFYHEVTHSILRTMGEYELNSNEKFVCSFSSFLCEAMEKAVFIEEEKK